MKILAIETSCDETAIAIAEFLGLRKNPRIKILSNIVSSQVKLHAKFGGVVPNLAKREHQRNLPQILIAAFKESKLLKNSKSQITNYKQIPNSKFQILNSILEREPELFARMVEYLFPLKPPKIDAVAVTYGPGLAPALWVGVNFAKALAYLWDKPIIPVNHMEGHLYSAFLQKSGVNSKSQNPNYKQFPNSKFQILNIKFPAISLLVSGGHTELVLMSGHGKYKIIGETLDDAAGEAFDKVARLLGLGYPGGPHIAALAQYAQKNADKTQKVAENILRNSALSLRTSVRELKLPRPMLNSKDYNFSFSGLKTAVLYLLQDRPELKINKTGKAAVAREFQNAVVDVLVSKTIRAAKEFKVKTVLLGGGVAANKLLRHRLGAELSSLIPNSSFLIPDLSLTGDNALMIVLAAYFGKNKATKKLQKISAYANLRLDSEINSKTF